MVAGLTRMTRDLGLAEDLAQDALVQALEQWPRDGLPDNPGAWLMSTAKRRAVDYFRHNEVVRRKTAELGRDLEEVDMPDLIGGVDRIEDDVLRLIFLTCHPALPAEARAALTLRLVGGLTTSEIARGFLVKDATIGQRISRAKRTLVEVRADFEMPSGDERVARLDDVMGVIYLIFNEGYTATTGPDWMRPDLCAEAIRLARMLGELMPGEPDRARSAGPVGVAGLADPGPGRPRWRPRPPRDPGPRPLGSIADPSRPRGPGPSRGAG